MKEKKMTNDEKMRYERQMWISFLSSGGDPRIATTMHAGVE